MKLVLLPGLDGTGELFASFVAALEGTAAQVVRYPADRAMERNAAVPPRKPAGVAAAGLDASILPLSVLNCASVRSLAQQRGPEFAPDQGLPWGRLAP